MIHQQNLSFAAGLQKLTLLDYPGKMASTVFLPGCNFRCPFCHNAELVLPEQIDKSNLMSAKDILSFLEKRVGITEGVCFTGGEPLMNSGVIDLIRNVRDLGFSVKLDTNGSFPDRLAKVLELKLVDYVAMDIKNSFEKYNATIGVSGKLESVRESVSLLLDCSLDYEFRTTLVREFHEESDILAIAHWISGAKHYAIQNFVDSGHLIGKGLHAVSPETIKLWAEKLRTLLPDVIVRGIS